MLPWLKLMLLIFIHEQLLNFYLFLAIPIGWHIFFLFAFPFIAFFAYSLYFDYKDFRVMWDSVNDRPFRLKDLGFFYLLWEGCIADIDEMIFEIYVLLLAEFYFLYFSLLLLFFLLFDTGYIPVALGWLSIITFIFFMHWSIVYYGLSIAASCILVRCF